MKSLTTEETWAGVVRQLNLPPNVVCLNSAEAVAGLIRRAAGFFCPCPRATLRDAVLDATRGLADEVESFGGVVDWALDAMTAYGDLLEERDVTALGRGGKSTLLYASPPSFIWRQNRTAFLMGLAPDDRPFLPDDLAPRVNYSQHVRRIAEAPGEDLRARLQDLGLIELLVTRWSRGAPKLESSEEHERRLAGLLDPDPGALPGLAIINPEKRVTYYPGRWEEVKRQTGSFVARRPQAYGNPLWCYVELLEGRPVKLLDFPARGSELKGCDEAWRLQMAIDANRRSPQVIRVRPAEDTGYKIIDLFSPVPAWAQRRWYMVGEPTGNNGCLFSFILSASDVEEEITFAKKYLWLAPASE